MNEINNYLLNGKYYFEGTIDGSWNFLDFFRNKESPITLNFKSVRRMNSAGTRLWTESVFYHSNLQIMLEEVPVEIVNQFNMVPECMGNNQVRIVSFYGAFFCEDDEYEGMVIFNEGKHYHWGKGLIRERIVKCPICLNPMELDDSPKKFFRFLTYCNNN